MSSLKDMAQQAAQSAGLKVQQEQGNGASVTNTQLTSKSLKKEAVEP